MNIKIRKITLSDSDAIAEIEAVCFGPNAWSLSSVTEFIKNEYSHALIAECDGAVIGYAGALVVYGDADIVNVAVMPEHRRRGIAERLLASLEADCRLSDTETMFLEVRSKNAPAIALYEKLGFSAVGVRRAYYTSPTDDAIVMSKILKLQ